MDRDDERQTDLMLQRDKDLMVHELEQPIRKFHSQAQLLADFGRTKLRDLEGEVARNIAS
jgi:hypothetical protein